MAVLSVAVVNAPCSQVFTQRQQLFICSNNSVTTEGALGAEVADNLDELFACRLRMTTGQAAVRP